METLKFKTTIKCSGCVAKVTPFLNEAIGSDKWEVDTANPSKLLTVFGENDKTKVIEAVQKAGFNADAVEDEG
jgi:copper chaperone